MCGRKDEFVVTFGINRTIIIGDILSVKYLRIIIGGYINMKFPNALKGLKKIYTAEILMLVCGLLGGIAGVFGQKASEQIAEHGTEGLDIGTAFGVFIPIMLSGLIAIFATLIEFFGLKDASEDDENFKKGYTYALIGLIVTIVIEFLSFMKIGGDMVTDLGKVVSNFVQIVVTLYVIYGIRSLAEKLGDTEMAERGKKVFTIYSASVILASLVELGMAVLEGGTKTAVVGILGAVMLVLTIVGYVMYLRYLSSAKKMLA